MTTLKRHVEIYDTTLRDGAQGVGVNFSLKNRILIAQAIFKGLPLAGIEGGWPGSNPTDTEFFLRAKKEDFHAGLFAFGMTRKANIPVEEDKNIRDLIDSGVTRVTIVGKSSRQQVEKILSKPEKGMIVSLGENLSMIEDSIRFLKNTPHIRKVYFDAEHFFDGYKQDPEYTMSTLYAAAKGGADCVVLCDTNGWSIPPEISEITSQVVNNSKLHHIYRESHTISETNQKLKIGIHPHNDLRLAEANALSAVIAGADHVQGTVNGLGERIGNVDLIPLLIILEKAGLISISDEMKKGFTKLSELVALCAGIDPNPNQPVTGINAFRTAAGLHADATLKFPRAYAGIDPETVGNHLYISINGKAGKGAIKAKLIEMGVKNNPTDDEIVVVREKVKEQEAQGYRYTDAEASFYLLAKETIYPAYDTSFKDLLPNSYDYPLNASGVFHQLQSIMAEKSPKLNTITFISERKQAENDLKRVFIKVTDKKNTWITVGIGDTEEKARFEAVVQSLKYAFFTI